MKSVHRSNIEAFNDTAGLYAKSRPTYPRELFDFIVSQVPDRQVVWDCGTGNGQAAVELAKNFSRVVATDINNEQLAHAFQEKNIEYRCVPAEDAVFQDNSLSLVTCANSLHWFDLERFYPVVQRALKPEGIFAVWCYGFFTISPTIDKFIVENIREVIKNYWGEGNRIVSEEYKTIPFPFTEISHPEWKISMHYNFTELLSFMNTWSAVTRIKKESNIDPIDDAKAGLAKLWGPLADRRLVEWKLHARIGPPR